MRLYFFITIFLVFMFGGAKPASAVLPPSFVFDIGTQIFSIFSIVFALISSFFGMFVLYFRKKFLKNKPTSIVKSLYVILSVIIIFSLSMAAVFFYNEYKQKQEYNKWVLKSQNYTEKYTSDQNTMINMKFGKVDNRFSYLSNYFGLDINEQKNDDVVKFIYSYYDKLNKRAYDEVYFLSDKKITLDEYKEYYYAISKIDFDDIVRIDESRSSFELILYRGNEFEKYDILMTLSLAEDGKPQRISDIHSVLREKGSIIVNDFYVKNYVDYSMISHEDFNNIINSERDDYVIVDIREVYEYELGNDELKDISNILRIRIADLMAGRWEELPRDKYVYLFCGYGNVRSGDAVSFLRDKQILAFYIGGGLASWIDFQEGYFSKNKISTKTMKVMSTDDVLQEIKNENTFIVSSNLYIKGFDFYINYEMTTIEIDRIVQRIPPNSRIILICQGAIDCASNQMIWMDIQEKGHNILGIYNSPWEWEERSGVKN